MVLLTVHEVLINVTFIVIQGPSVIQHIYIVEFPLHLFGRHSCLFNIVKKLMSTLKGVVFDRVLPVLGKDMQMYWSLLPVVQLVG